MAKTVAAKEKHINNKTTTKATIIIIIILSEISQITII